MLDEDTGNSRTVTVLVGERRKLNSTEKNLLKSLDGIVPQKKLLALQSLWESKEKGPAEESWFKRNLIYFYLSVGIIFLTTNLYFKGLVATIVDYSRYTVTLNYLTIIWVLLLIIVCTAGGIINCIRLANDKEKFLTYNDIVYLRKVSALKKWTLRIMAMIFIVLYIFNGWFNVLSGVVLILVVYVVLKITNKVRDRALEDVNTLN